MHAPRWTLLGITLLVVLVGTAGCATSSRDCGPATRAGLPTDLPAVPEPCTTYCKVWVPPVYRDVPKLCLKNGPCTKQVPECVMETRYQEICTQPRCEYLVDNPDVRCEQAAVQVTPGGYKWKQDECGCWKYCYEEPCYQWCNKVVTEEGIDYCMERPPEYSVEVTHVPVTRYRTVYQPGEYEVKWEKELYTPGRWEWQPRKDCTTCDCPAPCPTIPQREEPCHYVTRGCPRTN